MSLFIRIFIYDRLVGLDVNVDWIALIEVFFEPEHRILDEIDQMTLNYLITEANEPAKWALQKQLFIELGK
jgi:hypothetical protein